MISSRRDCAPLQHEDSCGRLSVAVHRRSPLNLSTEIKAQATVRALSKPSTTSPCSAPLVSCSVATVSKQRSNNLGYGKSCPMVT
ncbi:unnamed protein product [Brassica oleracea]